MTPVATETALTTDDGAARRRRLPLTGALLAGALLLSACGGSPDGDTQAESEKPSASASSSKTDDAGSGEESSSTGEPSEGSGDDGASEESTGEPVPASSEGPAQNVPVPEAPAQITENSKEGAEATLEYWWELDVYARNTGDTEPLKEISNGDCNFCVNRVNHVIKAYNEGDWWKQDPHEVGKSGLTNQGENTFQGPFEISEGSFTTFYDDSDPKQMDGAKDQFWGATLKYDGNRWIVHNLSPIPENESEGGT